MINLTGHKLISGYPEGRRMWVNTKWYNSTGALLREDGAYGPITVTLDGVQRQVNTLLDLNGTNTRIYEVHGAMTQKWAKQLLAMGQPSNLPLSFNRVTGQVDFTLGDLAGMPIGTAPRDLPLRAQQPCRDGQPHPALWHEVRRGQEAQRLAGAGLSVRLSVVHAERISTTIR